MTKPNPKDYPNFKEWAEAISKYVRSKLDSRIELSGLAMQSDNTLDISIVKLQHELINEIGLLKTIPIKKHDKPHGFAFNLEELRTMYEQGIKK